MPMFDDPKKELDRLEKQLLKEEKWMEEELDSAKRMLGDAPAKSPASKGSSKNGSLEIPNAQVRNYANDYGKKTDVPAPQPKQEKPLTGLVVLACLETLGIVGVVIYWLIFLL